MKLIGASTLLPCNGEWQIIQNGGVVIDGDTIKEIGSFEVLQNKYPNCNFTFYKNHIMLPAFINSHVHFEFSKNDTSFRYGKFGTWLDSVMNNRGEVLKHNTLAMQQTIKTQKKSGVGSVCAISSYDLDLQLLLDSKLKVIYCHEVLGAMQENFEEQAICISTRLEKTLANKSQTFIPALALHAPYSVNQKIGQYIIDLALKYNLLVSTHFLESEEEYMWLTNQDGYFKDFYTKYFKIKDPKPYFDSESYLELFSGVRSLFVHCLYADSKLQEKIYKQGAIISCPRSNLLLNGKMGDNMIIATDGKSSNADVNLLEEARYALFTSLAVNHAQKDIEEISQNLLHAMTCNPARALGLNNGSLADGKQADIALFKFGACSHDNIASSFLLNAKEAVRVLVNGNDIL